eukprot:TRINITY_DN40168_c0_g1_i1.p1 TRINITY_DN40168_c0_g1~~TRINITY_DN40168_c0_g1_i1.p1  ORF type:complete len:367 (+),score=105.93 TRINITY_DN40168_c0_g1_i1:106-1206(+)
MALSGTPSAVVPVPAPAPGSSLAARYAAWLRKGGEARLSSAFTMAQVMLGLGLDVGKPENQLTHEGFNTFSGLLTYVNGAVKQRVPAPQRSAEPDLTQLVPPQPEQRLPARDGSGVVLDVIVLVQRLLEMAARRVLGDNPPYAGPPSAIVRKLVICLEAVKLLLVLRANRQLASAMVAAVASFRSSTQRGSRTGLKVPAVGASGSHARPSDLVGILADLLSLLRPFVYAVMLLKDGSAGRQQRPWRPWLTALVIDLFVLGATYQKSRLDSRDALRRARRRRREALADAPTESSSLRLSDDAADKLGPRARCLTHYLLREPAYSALLKRILDRIVSILMPVPLLGMIAGAQLQCWALLQPLHYSSSS